jgi:hypothetical protein
MTRKTCAESAIGSFTLPSRAAQRISLPSKRRKRRKQEPQLFFFWSPSLSYIRPGVVTRRLSFSVYTLIIMAFSPPSPVITRTRKKKYIYIYRYKRRILFLDSSKDLHWVETCTTSIVAGSKERESPRCVVRWKIKVCSGHWRNGKSQVFCVFFSSVTTRVRHGGRIIISAGGKSSYQKTRRRYTRKVVGWWWPINDQRFEVDSHCFPQAFEC